MVILRQKTFSEAEQKEFNSKAQKALRKTYDLAAGRKKISYPESQSVIIGEGRKANRKLYKIRGGNTNDSINVKALNLGAESSSSKLSQGITEGLTNKKSKLYDHGIIDIEDAKKNYKAFT
jgi:site-specific DNA-adenine methylase